MSEALINDIANLTEQCLLKDKEIEKLKEDISNYIKVVLHDRNEIERLNNIINKAIEYIEYASNWLNIDKRDNEELLQVKCVFFKKLLDILKGVDKE